MAGTIDVGTIKVGGLAELKAQLKEIKNELLNATDPAQMQRLAAEAGELTDQIKGMNEQIGVFATGSKFEATSNAFNLMSGQIASLDFEGAAESAKTFQAALGSITPAEIGKQVKGLISVVGSLSKAFIQFGISLLANPIFLIVAAVVAIAAAIVLLLNKFGLLKPILKAIGDAFKVVMKVIDAAIQAFKDLTDWLGLTANAAEDSAKRQIKASEEASKAAKAKSETTIDAMDHEIALMKASGKETAIAEAQKQKYILDTSKVELQRMEQRMRNHVIANDLSADEMKKLREDLAEQRKLVRETYQELEVMREANRKKVEENEEKVRQNAISVQAKRRDDAIQFEQNRLNAARQFQDLELELMDEGIQKELLANQRKYQREIEDLKYNKNLTKTERLKLEDELAIVMGAKADEIRKNYSEKALQQERDFQAKLKELTINENISRAEVINQDYQKQLADFQKLLDDKAITKEQYAQLEAAADAQRQANQDVLNQEYANRNREAEISMMAEGFAKKSEMLEFQKQQELANLDLTQQERIAIEQEYATKRAELEETERQSRVEAVNKTTQMVGDATKTGLQGISDIVGAFAGKSVSQQKKAFEIQKKINIVMATIDMIKGAVSAFSNAQTLGPIAGPIVGSLIAASVVASGIANIKKISATKFEGGGTTSPSAPSTTGGGEAASATAGPAQPSFSLFGQPNQANTMTGAKSVEAGQTTIQAVVVESEITTSQNKVKRMQESATL